MLRDGVSSRIDSGDTRICIRRWVGINDLLPFDRTADEGNLTRQRLTQSISSYRCGLMQPDPGKVRLVHFGFHEDLPGGSHVEDTLLSNALPWPRVNV